MVFLKDRNILELDRDDRCTTLWMQLMLLTVHLKAVKMKKVYYLYICIYIVIKYIHTYIYTYIDSYV